MSQCWGLTPPDWCLRTETWKAQINNTYGHSQMRFKTSSRGWSHMPGKHSVPRFSQFGELSDNCRPPPLTSVLCRFL